MANDVGWGAVEAITGVCVAAGGFLAAWFRFGAGSAKVRGEAKNAAERAAVADTAAAAARAEAKSAVDRAAIADASAAAAIGKCELLQRELSDLRESTLVDIAKLQTELKMTTKTVADAEERVADGLKDIMRALGQMGERIDRALESRRHT